MLWRLCGDGLLLPQRGQVQVRRAYARGRLDHGHRRADRALRACGRVPVDPERDTRGGDHPRGGRPDRAAGAAVPVLAGEPAGAGDLGRRRGGDHLHHSRLRRVHVCGRVRGTAARAHRAAPRALARRGARGAQRPVGGGRCAAAERVCAARHPGRAAGPVGACGAAAAGRARVPRGGVVHLPERVAHGGRGGGQGQGGHPARARDAPREERRPAVERPRAAEPVAPEELARCDVLQQAPQARTGQAGARETRGAAPQRHAPAAPRNHLRLRVRGQRGLHVRPDAG